MHSAPGTRPSNCFLRVPVTSEEPILHFIQVLRNYRRVFGSWNNTTEEPYPESCDKDQDIKNFRGSLKPFSNSSPVSAASGPFQRAVSVCGKAAALSPGAPQRPQVGFRVGWWQVANTPAVSSDNTEAGALPSYTAIWRIWKPLEALQSWRDTLPNK